MADVYAELDRLTDELCQLDTTGLGRDELPDALRSHEKHARRMAYASCPLIREAGERHLPDEHGCPSTGRLPRSLLRLHPREAEARARAAMNAAPTHTLRGQPMPAPFAHVSASQAAGLIGQEHASVITRTVDRVPDVVQAEHHDPDGAAPNEHRQQDRRRIGFRSRADGWTRVDGWLSPEPTERRQTILDIFAAPEPAVDLGDGRGLVKDTRTAAQRSHDGTPAAFETLLRVGDVTPGAALGDVETGSDPRLRVLRNFCVLDTR